MNTLKKEFEVKDLEEAEEKLAEYQDRIGKQEEIVKETFKKLQEEYEW